MGFFDRIREGLSKTKQQIVQRFDEIVSQAEAPERRGRPIDVDTIEALEELLIMADVGVAATDRIIAAVQEQTASGKSLRDAVKDEIRAIFASVPAAASNGHAPQVVLIVGVNGTGKTTTVGKLAQLLKSSGKQPLVVAADTFRAAAVEQLEVWARRAGVDLIRARDGRRSRCGRVRRHRVGEGEGPHADSRGHGRTASHQGESHERAREDPPRCVARGGGRAP